MSLANLWTPSYPNTSFVLSKKFHLDGSPTTPYNDSVVTVLSEKNPTQTAKGETKLSLGCTAEKSRVKWPHAQLYSRSHVLRWPSFTLPPSPLCFPLIYSNRASQMGPLVSPQGHYLLPRIPQGKSSLSFLLTQKSFLGSTWISPIRISCAISNQPLWLISFGPYIPTW